MNSLLPICNLPVKPVRFFLIFLATTFAVEACVMVALPFFVSSPFGTLRTAILDAGLVTVVLAPFVWLAFVVPLQLLAECRRKLLANTLTLQEEERGRIAQDLHDGLGQSLASLTVGLQCIERSLADESLREQAVEMRRVVGETHEEIRRIARGLRPQALDELGLAAAVEHFIDEFRSVDPAKIEYSVAGLDGLQIPRPAETALYRIVQESLLNAVKHGSARQIHVVLRGDPAGVTIEVRDDGRGFDPAHVFDCHAARHPFGLLSIRERAELLGGTAQINSCPGRGTQVIVHIPLAGAEVHLG